MTTLVNALTSPLGNTKRPVGRPRKADVKVNTTHTENNAVAQDSTGSSLVDAFFKLPAGRKMSEAEIITTYAKVYSNNPRLARRFAFWLRDVRGGSGERRSFRIIISWLCQNDPEFVHLVKLIPEYGRWDDLFGLLNSGNKIVEGETLRVIKEGLSNPQTAKLVAKWLPREKQDRILAARVRGYLGLTAKQYRKLLANLNNTVEVNMCANEWEEINYEAVPSVAMSRYKKAFSKHDIYGFGHYLANVRKGTAKINAGSVFPHDVIRNRFVAGTDEQWNHLPNFLGDQNILVMADVSGSMQRTISGSINAMDVCIGMAMYCGERLKGQFHNYFLTFSSEPTLQQIKGKTLAQKYSNLQQAHWSMNTDLDKALKFVLDHAVEHRVAAKDMPEVILIFSDMQFDSCGRISNYENLKALYAKAGYRVPTLVFWNLAGSGTTFEVKYNAQNVGLLSGFSPTALSCLSNISNPYQVVLDKLNEPRYAIIDRAYERESLSI